MCVLYLMSLYKRAPKLHPIESPNFIKITTYDRIHCIARVRVINPITKTTMSLKNKSVSNCTPVNLYDTSYDGGEL